MTPYFSATLTPSASPVRDPDARENILTVITDNIGMSADTTWATVVSASDYYPFGLTMAGRNYQDSLYRYGFNGKEKDDQGEWGNTNYDYGFRIYSPAIARFLSVDPLTQEYPWYTPYQFAGNKPIMNVDLDGLEDHFAADGNVIAVGPLSGKAVFEKRMDYEIAKMVDLEIPFRKGTVNLRSGWLSQSILSRPSVACWRACHAILQYENIDGGYKTDLIQVALENEDHLQLILTDQAESGVIYLDQQLEEGNLVLVGVNHTLGRDVGNEGTTDHFVVIDGRFYDEEEGKNYYRFNEVGTRDENKAKSHKNRLYLNDDGSISGYDHRNREITVTQVRRNTGMIRNENSDKQNNDNRQSNNRRDEDDQPKN